MTEENIQARIRGNLLMALSNKFGALLLTTGNKSELAVGYCTLYGDMSGGLAVIADVPKTMVYRLSPLGEPRARDHSRVGHSPRRPRPSCGQNQTDQDSLPPYDVLDAILERHIERHRVRRRDRGRGVRVARPSAACSHLVRVAEFKRNQAAPGLQVTDRAFGTGWRMPVARGDWDSSTG